LRYENVAEYKLNMDVTDVKVQKSFPGMEFTIADYDSQAWSPI
jgi:hypothetical protein